ncbi:type 1 glutamine amidotransferase [Syntrophobacter fumaroxidans]|uniref:Glutamine amidotransferase class-I n=1 Tax=Syntrophobacter fumaroxidans (strain DSM 10017 / MPOB) TaxID=335543 RepID=A0LJA2_SYNFM|nr:type 1 glutamine amidotransferase [Syntrophobacter fumaroxidans]ABK17504.1 glutamine amidotransferase class-I [Syntrophobacter fumaroxidans MPOB]
MIVIVQNDPEVPCGVLPELAEQKCIGYEIVPAFEGVEYPEVHGIRGAVVLGGKMSVHDIAIHPFLDRVKKYIGRLLADAVPFLGICLGGQLLAEVLGARVCRNSHGERGCRTVSVTSQGLASPLFRGLPERFVTFQWHDDSFDLPESAVRLARSESCSNQAFEWGGNAYGLQFHPEVDGRIVAAWSDGDERHVREFADREGHYRAHSRRLLENFLDIVLRCR